MTSPLSGDDVKRLLNDPSEQGRAQMAQKLAATINLQSLSDDERRLADEIIRVMAQDAAVLVRESLAATLKSSPNLPHDVALSLAKDLDQVAMPILEYSEVLSDSDLIALVKEAGEAKQVAMAKRSTVSDELADSLVEAGTEAVASTLLENPGAVLREATLGSLAGRFPDSRRVATGLIGRDNLPVTVVERMVATMSASVLGFLSERPELPAAAAKALSTRAQERATASLGWNLDVDQVEKLVGQLASKERLTPSLILRTLAMGDLLFFETAMAKLADIPLNNSRILIHEGGELGLKSLYQRAGLPGTLFSPFKVAVDVVAKADLRDEDYEPESFARTMLERVLSDCDDLADQDADWLLERLHDLAPRSLHPA